ncbi:hypothetical protein [Moraxella lacunata]|uniref:hypothetical protein n=1 Tax=Moraxella lacunata TaxID=477 RepID=UPI003EE26C22
MKIKTFFAQDWSYVEYFLQHFLYTFLPKRLMISQQKSLRNAPCPFHHPDMVI